MTHSDRSPAINASFGLPQLPKTVPHRPRVVRLFEEAFESAHLVVVRAAPGSGKTSAAADWAAGSEGAVAWINLSGDESSSEAMWSRILHSCRHLATPGSSEAEAITKAITEMESGGLLPELMLRTIADIGAVTLVLDGMKPHPDSSFLRELVYLLGALPLFRTILIYQEELLPGQSNILRQVDVAHVGDEQLFLTSAEVHAQVKASDSELDPDLVFLHTHGFPILVRSLLTTNRGQLVSGTSKDIEALVGSWIRAGILHTVEGSEGYSEFMIKTSIAETFSVELATKLTGRNDSSRILSRIAARGLIVRESGKTYRYRRTVRLALRQELAGSHPQWLAECRRVMIDHYVASGMVPRALGVAVEARDYAAAERIASCHQDRLLFLHPDESASILSDIPDVKMLRYPLLAMTAGLLLSRAVISRDRGMRLLAGVLAGLESAGPGAQPESRKFFPLAEMVALRVAGRSAEALRILPRAVEAVEATCPKRQREVAGTSTSVHIQAGLTLLLEGWTKEARIQLRHAASAPPSQGKAHGQITCLGLLGLAYAMDGRIKDAEPVLATADGFYSRSSLDSWLHAPYLVARAFCAIERGAPEKALEILGTEDFDLTASELWPIALTVRGLAEMLVDPARVNLDDIERSISATNPRPTSAFAGGILRVGLSAIHLVSGNADQAASVLEGVGSGPHVQLGKARLALAEGDFAKAEKILPAEGASWTNSERAESQKLFMRAAIAGHSGRKAEAKELHSKALQLNSRSGLGDLLSVLPDPALEYLPGGPTSNSHAFSIPAVRASARLTARERIVLMTLAASESAAVAARELGVSLNTVKAQSRSIYRKLNVSTLRDALAVARSMRLI